MVHRPNKFFFDFSSTTPRIEKGGLFRLMSKHNVAVVDPYLAKELVKVLKENIEKYEDKFGEISKPKEFEKIEQEAKEKGDEPKVTPENYFG